MEPELKTPSHITIRVQTTAGADTKFARVVLARSRMLQDCYLREQKRQADLAGTIELQLTINESGRVTAHEIKRAEGKLEVVANCCTSRMRRWRFPKPEKELELQIGIDMKPPSK